MKEIRDFKFPIIAHRDLKKNANTFDAYLYKDVKNLIKAALIHKEKRGRSTTYFISRKGKENLSKWEEEEDQV